MSDANPVYAKFPCSDGQNCYIKPRERFSGQALSHPRPHIDSLYILFIKFKLLAVSNKNNQQLVENWIVRTYDFQEKPLKVYDSSIIWIL